ncbi:hypothetical protein [Haloarcula amylovorans]|uniref:hypothetical protein n=1 Tax=Haloarcula amylovorans TaxID=2562280 RepID=UPI001075F608|nr:hypothetical protein [Halomicroarcula amylolytica]
MSQTRGGMSGVRQANEKAVEKFDSADLSGGVMPRDLFEDWFRRVQDTAMLMNMVRTEVLPRPKMELARIGVGERMRRGGSETEGTSSGSATVNTDGIQMDAEKGLLSWDLQRESVEDTIGQVDEIVLDKMASQWATDTQDLGINGDTTDTSGGDSQAFLRQNDGWLKILNDRTDTNTYDHQGGAIDTSLWHEARSALPNKFKRNQNVNDPVYMMNLSHIEDYEYDLTQREDPLGAAVLFSDDDITPFNYDVYGFAAWPEDTALFTYPENLIYGVWRETEIEVLDATDKTAENDLFARYFMRTRDDFSVEDENGAVLMNNLPTA